MLTVVCLQNTEMILLEKNTLENNFVHFFVGIEEVRDWKIEVNIGLLPPAQHNGKSI